MKNKETLLLLFVFILSLAGCSPKQQQDYITIGALFPLTGESSDEGLRALNGLQLAKEEVNTHGGVLGKKLDIIVLNDKGDNEYIVQQYRKLKDRGVVAIIGSSYSGPTLALAIEVEKDGMPIISPTASNPSITIGRKNVFRTIFPDDYQAEAMAYFAYNSLNAKTAVVFSNKNSESFKQVSEFFAKSFSALGGQIINIEPYSTEDNFVFLLQKYTTNPPDVIFYPDDYIPAAKLVNSAYEARLTNTSLLGSDAWDGIIAYVNHPEALENAYYSAPFMFDDNSFDATLFVRNYSNTFSQMPLSGSANAYTCVYVLSEAIKKAGNTNKEDIISALKTNELDVITGRFKFDENNNPRTNVYIIRMKGGVYSTCAKLSL